MTTTTVDLAGRYVLRAALWREEVSEPGAANRVIAEHRRGDTVTLTHENAVRLLKAGSVEPTASTAKAVADLRAAGLLEAPTAPLQPGAANMTQPVMAVTPLVPDKDNPHLAWPAPPGWR